MEKNEKTEQSTVNSAYKPLRVWIPVLLLPCMGLVRFLPDFVQDGPSMIWMASAFGPFLIGLLIMGWWVFASRARWVERLLGVFGLIGVLVLVLSAADPSMKGPLVAVMTIPMAIAGFAIGLVAFAQKLSFQRTLFALAMALLAAGFTTLVKSDGVWGNFAFGMDWRWNKSPEQKFLERRSTAKLDSTVEKISLSEKAFESPEWPNFRGPNQDSSQHGLKFSDDWKTNPPKEMWRIAVGPAWSAFVVAGNYLVTQEQREDSEAVVCYAADSGKQVWEHSIPSRFYEGLGGLGPRATPTISRGAIYAMGAEGWLIKLNALTGELVWKVDIRKAAQRDPPMWGFSSSPLVDGDLVSIHTAGKANNGIMAFDIANGELKWSAPAGEQSYASPQIVSLHGQKLLALLSNEGVHLLEPATGKSVFNYDWPHMGYRALQTQVVDQNRLLIPTGLGTGTRLIEVSESGGKLDAKELWTSRKMKPDFNDIVIHRGYCYGFDNAIFGCLDLKDGSQKWAGGRYGKGQVLLLADSDLLLVLSEKGELVLLRASPESFKELAKIQAMEGKTWNHPVVVGDNLYIRNAEEAVCYRLPVVQ